MEIISEGMPSTAPAPQSLPRFADGTINMQELIRSMAEMLTNEIMSAEADQLCESTGNSRNGYRERKLVTCVGTLTLRIPKLRSGSFFPEDVIERYQRVDRAVAAAVNEMYATGTSTRKVAKVAAAMGIERLSKDQVSAMVSGLDADNEELLGRDLSGLRMPYLWLDATYVKCRTGAHVASVAVVTAIGCDEDGWRHVLGLDVVDTESHDSWLGLFFTTTKFRISRLISFGFHRFAKVPHPFFANCPIFPSSRLPRTFCSARRTQPADHDA